MMPKYLQLNPMHDQIESEMERIREIVAPHVSKGKMEAIKVSVQTVDEVESIDNELLKIEVQERRLFRAVVMLLFLASVDISLHWIL